LIFSQTMAPETQQHFTEIYCDKESRLSVSGDDPCIWDLCCPHRCVQQLQSSLSSPQEARIYRDCVALLHNHSHVIIIQHSGPMEYIKPYMHLIHSTLQNMCHVFHNSHNNHPYIQQCLSLRHSSTHLNISSPGLSSLHQGEAGRKMINPS